MRILAFDQSSRITGWALFEDNKLIKYDKFIVDNNDIGERLVQIRKAVQTLIETYKPDHVVLEDIQLQNNVGNNVQTFKTLAEVFGVIYEYLTENDISNSAVLAATWKSALGIKGRVRAEQKRNAQVYVQNTYGINAIQDIVDAICIGTYYCQATPKTLSWAD